MKRGEVYLADLEPVVGSEANKTRPCIIVSSDASNHNSPTVTVVPVTSVVHRVYSFEVALGAELSRPARRKPIRCAP